MADHIYAKDELIRRFDSILGKTLGEIDDQGMFAHVQEFDLQKGVVGTLIELCVLGYAPDAKQEADLVVTENGKSLKTELKSTGMVIRADPVEHFVAKEPMSITAVGIYDITEQSFRTSHFWNKLEHMLIVYYLYASDHAVSPFEYRKFPIKGYEFHEFSENDTETLRQDWEHVRSLVEGIIIRHPGPRTKSWKEEVKQEYIDIHGQLRRVLSYIDLAPKFPPRFRLKKPVVSALIAAHFGYQLEQLPGRYTVISDIDRKCRELTERYGGMTIRQLATQLEVPLVTERSIDKKGISEQIVIAMFGGTSKKLNQIDLFSRFGLIAKSIVMTPAGGKTEDMKLFHIDFDEMARTEVTDEDGHTRQMTFEDSELYSYFADHEFLCILFEEPDKQMGKSSADNMVHTSNPLSANRFIGFKRLVFSDEFINHTVRRLWDDTRRKIRRHELVDIIRHRRDGSVVTTGSGEASSAPNFMKSRENDVFIRGSGINSFLRSKTECVNGIRMLPQYVWIKGTAVIDELEKMPLL